MVLVLLPNYRTFLARSNDKCLSAVIRLACLLIDIQDARNEEFDPGILERRHQLFCYLGRQCAFWQHDTIWCPVRLRLRFSYQWKK
ncbi:hypothetical protein SAMN05216552_10344 [Pseudoduganella namucuonensis]|uniref:Uncharacterized protein n=1 Tax=Pseudoduganella namucuonensis TaxID=1035707 RepID=A0A1I7LNW9_9BURK|nr:hypothetical protein SAMN05216552_10344 [Pseudoduganella namucuonensis]